MKQKIIIATVIFSMVFGLTSAQTTIDELKGDISEKQALLDQLTTEIQNLQKDIAKKQKEAATLKNEVVLYDLNIRQTETKIRAVEVELDKLAGQIRETEIAIQTKTEEINKEKDFLAEALRLLNEYDLATALEITLANDTFSEFLDQVQYTTNLQEKTQDILDTLKRLKTELEEKKALLAKSFSDQEALKGELEATRTLLQEQRNSKQSLLSYTKGQEKAYKALLSETAKKQEEVEREIFELEVAIRNRLGDKSLPAISGLLRWPMSGILTQGYGNTGFTALGYTFHNGIDIGAPGGTKVYAAGDGVVFATGTGAAAYGNWVVIKHTISDNGKIYNIYTLYGHLQKFIVNDGQALRGGDLIGYNGNTGNTTRLLYGPERGFHLHFTIFDEEGFDIRPGAFQNKFGPYQIPYGYTYNPMNFLK